MSVSKTIKAVREGDSEDFVQQHSTGDLFNKGAIYEAVRKPEKTYQAENRNQQSDQQIDPSGIDTDTVAGQAKATGRGDSKDFRQNSGGENPRASLV
jgi:hypothetical protein